MAPATCADADADGTANDPHDCSGHANLISASPADITCAAASCTDAECCTDPPPEWSGVVRGEASLRRWKQSLGEADLRQIVNDRDCESFMAAVGYDRAGRYDALRTPLF